MEQRKKMLFTFLGLLVAFVFIRDWDKIKAERETKRQEQVANDKAELDMTRSREISRQQDEQREKVDKIENQKICLSAFNSIASLLQGSDMIGVSQYCYHNYESIPLNGFNEGCAELKMVMMSLKEIYEDGTVPPPAKFEYLARKLQDAGQLLKNPRLKLEDLRTVASE